MAAELREYRLSKVDLTTDRQEGFTFSLTGLLSELNIYENIELPYLTATMLIGDNVALRSSVKITGTERVSIQLDHPESSTVINKRFIVTGIQKEVKPNDRTDFMLITMIEEHAYFSTLRRYSKSLTGTPEVIIKDIARSDLDKDLDTKIAAYSAQSTMRYLVPYETPLEAIETIRDRMATSNGSPYFVHAALRDDKLHLVEMALLYDMVSWNQKSPYIYGQNATSVLRSPSASSAAARTVAENFVVQQYSASKIESSLKLIQGGAMGSQLTTVDLTSGRRYSRSHSGRDTAVKLIEGSLNKTATPTIDNSLVIGNSTYPATNIDDYPSAIFTQVVASKIFETGVSGYHDENIDASKYILKLRAAALRAILLNSVYTVSVPGMPFLTSADAGVGTNIDIVFTNPSQSSTAAAKLDEDKSGKFLIYKARHTFKDNRYDVHMDIVRLSKRAS